MVTKEDCEREGKIFVPAHTTEDGSYVHAYCRDKGMINPALAEINRNYRELANTIKADSDLRKYGTKVHGGYTLSVGQIQDYFREHDIPVKTVTETRRDRNGNTRLKWKRHSDSRETEYITHSGSKEGVVKSHDGYSVWWVEHDGKRVEGRTKSVSEAKYEVERRMRD